MIPKIIHYCWFGGNPLPELAERCISSWKKYNPDYEIKRWDESNFILDLSYVKEAYKAKKWAFVSDYARLKIIYENGGIYLDTDVELLKSLDPLLEEKCFLGVQADGFVATGLGFGAEKNHRVIRALLDIYIGKHFEISRGIYDLTPCPEMNNEVLTTLGFRYSGEIWKDDDVTVYPPEYFCAKNYNTGEIVVTESTYSIHHYTASWHTNQDSDRQKIINETKKRYKGLRLYYELLLGKYRVAQKYEGFSNIFQYIENRIRMKLIFYKKRWQSRN